MKPLISIIIPVYKAEQYLERCIDSVLNQTYKNLEIILVEDGSPDNSGKLCDNLALRDYRIKVIHKTNGGASESRNFGLDIANGVLIGFVDSDDYIHPSMFDLLYNSMIVNNTDIAICRYQNTYGDINYQKEEINKIETKSNIEALHKLFAYSCIEYILPWNKLYKKHLFEEIRYPVGKIFEDEFTTYKLLYKANKISVIENRLYFYFQSPNSVMRSDFSEKNLLYSDAMEERLTFFKQENQTSLYENAYRRYCIWLLCFNYKYRNELIKHPEIKISIKKKQIQYIKRVEKLSSLPLHSKIAFKLSLIFPKIFEFLAYEKLYRYNIFTITAKYLFSDPIEI